MKKFIYLFAIGFLFLAHDCAAQTRDSKNRTTPITFERYTSYFEKNNSNLPGDSSFLILKSQADFDRIFGSAATMEANSFLPEKAFDSMIVVAAIKRGAAVRTYETIETNSEKETLYVSYKATDAPSSSATFSSPLILSIPKGKYKKVVFLENGKPVKTLNYKK